VSAIEELLFNHCCLHDTSFEVLSVVAIISLVLCGLFYVAFLQVDEHAFVLWVHVSSVSLRLSCMERDRPISCVAQIKRGMKRKRTVNMGLGTHYSN
jgi:hypothetical protein